MKHYEVAIKRYSPPDAGGYQHYDFDYEKVTGEDIEQALKAAGKLLRASEGDEVVSIDEYTPEPPKARATTYYIKGRTDWGEPEWVRLRHATKRAVASLHSAKQHADNRKATCIAVVSERVPQDLIVIACKPYEGARWGKRHVPYPNIGQQVVAENDEHGGV